MENSHQWKASRANLVYYHGYFTLPSSSLVGATRDHNNTDPNLTWIETKREREREGMKRWRATDKRRERGGRLESGVHGYKGVAGRKVNRTGESFVPVTSWWNVSRNFCSGNWRSIVMQEVACRTRKTEETLSNSFFNPTSAYVLVENCTCYEYAYLNTLACTPLLFE